MLWCKRVFICARGKARAVVGRLSFWPPQVSGHTEQSSAHLRALPFWPLGWGLFILLLGKRLGALNHSFWQGLGFMDLFIGT